MAEGYNGGTAVGALLEHSFSNVAILISQSWYPWLS